MLDLAGLLVTAGGLDRVAGACAVDENPLLPMDLTSLGKPGIDAFVAGHVDVAEYAANLLRHGSAAFLVHVENGDLHPLIG